MINAAIDQFHAARITQSIHQIDVAIAAGDLDAAADHLAIAILRSHARRADQIPDDPARTAPPDHLTDDGYADDVARWRDDQGTVNDELWEIDNG
jgi:hypothetical protein